MPEYTYKTLYGTFRVTISDDNDHDTMSRRVTKLGTNISIGGKNTCVFFSVPVDKNTAYLSNLKTTDGGCEITDKIISGKNTVGMVNLGITIIRKIAPHIQYIRLEDMSDFPCKFDNGSVVGISMMLYELAFYQQAYYERRFGAYLLNDTMRKMYEDYKSGFLEHLPNDFSFNNKDLEDILRPLYLESKNWKEFFDKVHELPNVCQILFPWYRSAMMIIFKGVSFERQVWYIDLKNNSHIFPVEYTVLKEQKGGKRKTRKNINYPYSIYNSDTYYNQLSYDHIYNLKYKV
jgi:hypothetical protein